MHIQFNKPTWRNRYTRLSQKQILKGLRVRVPLLAVISIIKRLKECDKLLETFLLCGINYCMIKVLNHCKYKEQNIIELGQTLFMNK